MSSFDRVQHDALMARVARRVHDKRVLRLIRRYLEAGVMADGLMHASEEGTPQGFSALAAALERHARRPRLGARSPRAQLRALRRRRTYLRQKRAGGRAGHGEHHALRRAAPEAARQPTEVGGRPCGPSGPCWGSSSSATGTVRIGVTVAPKALKRAKERIRELTTRNWGVSMKRRVKEINRFTVGWTAYYSYADTHRGRSRSSRSGCAAGSAGALEGVETRPHQARYRNLRALGIPAATRAHGRLAEGLLAHRRVLATPTRAADRLLARDHGLEGFSDPTAVSGNAKRTARCGPACRVVWGAPG